MALKNLSLALVSAVLLAGCVYVPLGKVPQLTAGTLAAAGKASLVLAPKLHEGAFSTRPETFTTQAMVVPYRRADVQHVLYALYKVENGTESAIVDPKGRPVTRDVPATALDEPLTFDNLHPDAIYRVRAFAFVAPGTASADVISVEASSSLEVKVTGGEKPTTAELPVTLMEKPFGAEGATPVDFVSGTYQTEREAFR